MHPQSGLLNFFFFKKGEKKLMRKAQMRAHNFADAFTRNAHSKKKMERTEKNADEKICKFFVFSFFEKTKKEEKQPLFLFYIHYFFFKKKWRKSFDFNLNFLFLGYEQGHLIRNQK